MRQKAENSGEKYERTSFMARKPARKQALAKEPKICFGSFATDKTRCIASSKKTSRKSETVLTKTSSKKDIQESQTRTPGAAVFTNLARQKRRH